MRYVQHIAFGLAAVLSAACSTAPDANTGVGTVAEPPAVLTLYSPAKAPNLMYARNVDVADTLRECGVAERVDVVGTALPDSVIDTRDMADRATHLPVLTTIDFRPAVDGAGPDWHAYPDPNPDLFMIAPLYDAAIGVMAVDPSVLSPADLRGRAVAVPPRPSSLRVAAEAILHDAWGLEGEVDLLDMSPPDAVKAVREGRVAATTWNILVQDAEGGYVPMIPPIAAPTLGGRWLSLDADDIDRMNAGRDFNASITRLGDASLLSFRQGLAAWAETDAGLVRAIAGCLADDREGTSIGAEWPDLAESQRHPALR